MRRSVLPTLGLMFSLLAPAAGRQQPAEPRQQSAPDEDEVVRISTNLSYVNLGRPEPAAAPAPAGRKGKEFIPPPPARLRPEQVRRTLALVVDDLSLSFESTVFVRRALNKFIDEQMQPD